MAYNARQKVGKMPEHHHPHDADWINGQLNALIPSDRIKVCTAYSKAHQEAFEREPMEAKKAGSARFEANNRLRRFIVKKFKVFG